MHVVVTAVGADRPGIVAAVTRALYEHGANIEDSRSAILGGHFAMVLMVALPSSDPGALEAALIEAVANLGLSVAVRPVAELPAEQAEGDGYTLSVYGADRPGIVARVSELLAGEQVNIWDLATHVIEGDPPVYVMILEVAIPSGTDTDRLEAQLTSLAKELDVDVSLQPMEPETL